MSIVVVALTGTINGVQCADSNTVEATIHYNQESLGFKISPGIDKSGAAYAKLENGTAEGWSVLDLVVNAESQGVLGNTELAMKAAGTLESYLTCWHISEFSKNNGDIHSVQDQKIQDFTTKTNEWTTHMAQTNTSDYWVAVKNVLAQFQGISDGYQKYCVQEQGFVNLTTQQMLYMQMDGDLGDLQSAFGVESERHHTRHSSSPTVDRNGLRCTMLAKLAPDNSDLWFGHATWDTFSNMAPRIYKTYTVPVQREGKTVTHTTAFSSSPSWLSSIDDWYTVKGTSSMAVIETSHDIENTDLYKHLNPQTVSSWIRVIVANQLATDGASWGKLFSYAHSGTYNNEWQIIDMTKFTPGQPPNSGLLTIVEEIPGMIQTEDVTPTLVKDLFWPSFNIPYLPDIQKAAGYTHTDWETDQRHCLLTTLHSSVTSIATMEKVMRHNDYKHDSCSKDNACGGAIACRADLQVPGQPFGALDAKWSSWSVYTKETTSYAQMGSTHDQQPVFCWPDNSQTPNPHHGHPQCFNFSTVPMTPAVFAD